MGAIARFATGRRSKWVVIAAWVVAALVAFPFQSKLQTLASDESGAFESRDAESTRVAELIEQRFPGGADTTTLVLYTRDGPFTPQDAQRVAADAAKVCKLDVVRVITAVQLGCGELPKLAPPPSAGIGSESGDLTTQFATVWTSDDATESVVRDVGAIRAIVPDPDASGLRAYVTGEAAFAADQAAALEGIDETLLAVTLVMILVLLLAIYRSPVLALLPLVVVGIAYLVAAAVVYAVASAGAFRATGQATAILIVLMFGLGTDYCLLLLARYREELTDDPHAAMTTALRRTGPAIVSAGGIVVVVMLALGVADYNATRWMGPVLAIGTAITVLAGITLLPALLVSFGLRAKRRESTLWPRIGAFVKARPAALATAVLALLIAGSLGNLRDNGTLDFAEQFRSPPESVAGLRVMQEKFPPGQSGPLDVVIDVRDVIDALPKLSGGVYYGESIDGRLTLIRIFPDGDPFNDDIAATIPERRQAARASVTRGPALVGGPTAEIHDTKQALARDAKLIVPLALGLVFLIVAALLRSLIAPVYVIGTVLLSYAFALGVSSLIFKDSDPAMPLFTFLFLVALGVDYNIFLLARIREEGDVIKGLVSTGGVITSAGLILAGTFCTLLATELESLFQVGFTVALGLLVDTFLIRIFLVPSIALLLGSKAR